MIMRKQTLDDRDISLLLSLQKDARVTNQKLAEWVNLSASACLTRVRRLELTGAITGYHARIDIRKIRPNVTIYAQISLTDHHPQRLRQFEDCILDVPEIVAAAQVSGNFDYLLTVSVEDVQAWRNLADHLLSGQFGIANISSNIEMFEVKSFKGYPCSVA
jgi:DNA-binding Lrp family transcriptional regulator